MRRTRKILIGLSVFALLIVGARIAAPHFVLKYVNQTLDGLDGYAGHVDGVDLHIWRGAYEIEGVTIEKTAGKKPIPLLSVDRIDISVEWKALLDGSIVGEIDLYAPKLNFVAEKKKESKAEDQAEKREAKRAAQGEETSWQTQVKKLVPLKINRVGVHDGEIHFRDPYESPKVNVFVHKFRGEVTNLTNSEDLSETLAATASFRGRAMRSGNLRIDAKIDPYQKLPTFSLDAQLENLEAKQLNDFLKAYANVDAESGTISVYTEVKAEKGRFRGYVKPLIRELRIIRWKNEEEGLFGKLWETLVEAGTELFENHDKEQIATKIPMAGKLDDPNPDVLATVLYVLRNAFVEALRRGLDSNVDMSGGLAGRLSEDELEDK
jgi:hypothetical protein